MAIGRMARAASLNPKTRSDWTCKYTNMFGESFDLGGIVDQISVFESIYNDCMVGAVLLKDSQGFAERQNIIGAGMELVEVTIETTGGAKKVADFNKTFRVDSYSGANYTNDGTGTVNSTLGIVSPHLIKNNKTKIHRSFNAMTASDIVDYICNKVLKLGEAYPIEWDELQTNEITKNNKNIVVPGWTPFQTINWLARHSMSAENSSSNYVFFENNEGFHFTSIDKLKGKEPTRTYTMGTDISKSITGNDKGGMLVRTNMAEKFSNTKRFSHNESMLNGLYGGTLNTHNILTKEYNNYQINYDIDEVVMGWAGLNGASQFGKSPAANIGFMPDEYLYQVHNKKDKTHYAHRDMKLAEMRANVVKFDIAGDTNIWAGTVIELVIPTGVRGNDESDEDENMGGNWLVTAIHHKINNMEYVMTLECMKDGFEKMPGE